MTPKAIFGSFVDQPRDNHVINAYRRTMWREEASGSFDPGPCHGRGASTSIFIFELEAGNSVNLIVDLLCIVLSISV